MVSLVLYQITPRWIVLSVLSLIMKHVAHKREQPVQKPLSVWKNTNKVQTLTQCSTKNKQWSEENKHWLVIIWTLQVRTTELRRSEHVGPLYA